MSPFIQSLRIKGWAVRIRQSFANALRRSLRELLAIETIWFDGEIGNSPVDVTQLRQWSSLPDGISGEIFHTSIIDLEQEEKILWSALRKTVQYEVRRADREGVHVLYNQHRDAAAVSAFVRAYHSLHQRKHLVPLSEVRVRKLMTRNDVTLTAAVAPDGTACSWHVYVLRNDRSRLLYSVSNFVDYDDATRRAFIGRANRLHHWRDILEFRSYGYKAYDFGGWYSGTKDRAKLQINAFKEGFGGSVEVSYNAEIARSLRGAVALFLQKATSGMQETRVNYAVKWRAAKRQKPGQLPS